ncbi:hypothetical protein EDB92DRAFT_1835507 [Lactarius akahatsu]|uniref:Uncharacterized protein n=1 Tax=Lactarius akahatsu TaxID=416441 RepID=A0AAD4LQ49_9AGAM|nr:hypothetical protein EDB92DRAFT_1835507 [Lactarius akahatsu]
MTTWQEFLVKHAKFPFPDPVENGSVSATDIPYKDVGVIAPEWRAKYAVPDKTLVQRLCRTLDSTTSLRTLFCRTVPESISY